MSIERIRFNRLATSLLGILIAATANTGLAAGMQTERVYLSGKGPSDAVEWDFYCSSGRKSGEWTTIPVPSNWEQHGFGGYDYGHVPADEKHDEIGTYRSNFTVPKEWENRYVRLVFEGSMTETSIKVNGQAVGAPHLGGYLPFSVPLNASNHFRKGQMPPVLRFGEENELEVTVSKKPSNRSLDLAERGATTGSSAASTGRFILKSCRRISSTAWRLMPGPMDNCGRCLPAAPRGHQDEESLRVGFCRCRGSAGINARRNPRSARHLRHRFPVRSTVPAWRRVSRSPRHGLRNPPIYISCVPA
jgi:hypothetical protein